MSYRWFGLISIVGTDHSASWFTICYQTRKSSVRTMQYQLVEQGRIVEPGRRSRGPAFQRYITTSSKTGDSPQDVTIDGWIQAMLSDEGELQQFLNVLKAANSFDAFFFETRPVTKPQMASKPFEFVLVDAPSLHEKAMSHPDSHTFAKHFEGCTDSACTFPNLGRDATLIAPRQSGNAKNFSHLAYFCRHAPLDVVTQTWKVAIQAYADTVRRQTPHRFWFSTSGMGVSWLHFRIERSPKYYTYPPFRDAT